MFRPVLTITPFEDKDLSAEVAADYQITKHFMVAQSW